MAEVSQRFIDLLNVPLEVLRGIAGEKKVVGFASMTKWALAEQLDSLPRAELEGLTGGYLYAGRTAVTFFRLEHPPKKPDEADAEAEDAEAAAAKESAEAVLEGVPLKHADVEGALRGLSDAGDPFSEASRPANVSREPQLVVARQRADGSILMTFVVEGSTTHVLSNFTIESVVVDDFFSAVVYPDDGLVEVRTNQGNALRFSRTWLKAFAEALGLVPLTVSITPGDFKALADELDAGTTAFRGKNTSGGAVDTIEIKMAPGHATLTGDETFEDKVAGTEQQLGGPCLRARRREVLSNPCITRPWLHLLRHGGPGGRHRSRARRFATCQGASPPQGLTGGRVRPEVVSAVHDLAHERASRFRASFVAARAGVPVEDARRDLLRLASVGMLLMNFELLCPFDDASIATFRERDQIPATFSSEECGEGEEFEVTPELIWVTFTPTDKLRTEAEQERASAEKQGAPPGKSRSQRAAKNLIRSPTTCSRPMLH
jgi:hypothetical protein